MATMKPGPKPLAAFIPAIIEPALAARGLSEASLIADWPAIVGETIARFVRPIALRWPPRASRRDPETPLAPSTLVLRVESAFALEAQHCAPVIIARVNAHLGWRCVEKIAFRQGPLPRARERSRPASAPSPEAHAAAMRAVSSVEDGDLREALIRLGARAIDRYERRLAATPGQKGGSG